MNNFFETDICLELYAWIDSHEITSNALNLSDKNKLAAPQQYFAEYHLEFCRQRQFRDFPSRLHSSFFFATRTDAEIFADFHPEKVATKNLAKVLSKDSYKVSFHDHAFLEYLNLPHSLDLKGLNEIAQLYWAGKLAKDTELIFLDEIWDAPPIIEAIFQGKISAPILQIENKVLAISHKPADLLANRF